MTVRNKNKSSHVSIPEPLGGWYSLGLLLQSYSPAQLASAIELHGILVVDAVGRRVPATDGSDTDKRSKAYAILLLEARYVELENLGPQYSWEAERWDTEQHPTYSFGWLPEQLPNLDAIPVSGAIGAAKDSTKDWTQRPVHEFVQEKAKAGSFAKAGKAVEQFLKALAVRFNNSVVGADTSVFNASRITKVIGTVARKGIASEGRPYRIARLV